MIKKLLLKMKKESFWLLVLQMTLPTPKSTKTMNTINLTKTKRKMIKMKFQTSQHSRKG